LVNRELLLQNEYLAAENRILKAHSPRSLRLSDGERSTLAEIGKRLRRKGLQPVARLAKPDTILGWYRQPVSQHRRSPGRPRVSAEIENLVVRLAREDFGWGYDRIVGALATLGHTVSDQTVGNILRRHGIAPVPERSQTATWRDFIRPAYGRPRWHGLLHGGSADMARSGDVLCSIFPHLDSLCVDRRNHRSSGRELDEPGSAIRRWRSWDICTAVATFCRIAMPSSALNSGGPWRQAV
jgi:hypothetical protein